MLHQNHSNPDLYGLPKDGPRENRKYSQGYWSRIIPRSGSTIPCPRSLHAGAVWGDSLYIFGGYDGQQRCNDLHRYNFQTNCWTLIDVSVITPSRRDRHSAVVFENFFYVFGGFDGRSRVNDIHAFDLENNVWHEVDGPLYGVRILPTPRHSHSAVVYGQSMYIFGGGYFKEELKIYHYIILHRVYRNEIYFMSCINFPHLCLPQVMTVPTAAISTSLISSRALGLR